MLVILFGIWLGFSGVQWYFHNISSKNAFLQFSVGEQESIQRFLSYELPFITAFSKICSSNLKFGKSQIFEQNPVFWLYTRNFAHFTLQEVWTVKFACAIVYSVGHGITRGIQQNNSFVIVSTLYQSNHRMRENFGKKIRFAPKTARQMKHDKWRHDL